VHPIAESLTRRNIASVSWGDHLAFGDGDGRLETLPAIARRIAAWRDDLGATVLHWRLLRARIPGTFWVAPGCAHASQCAAERVAFDEFVEVPRLARAAGLRSELYVSLFDEGWPLASADLRATSHHNAMHGKDVAWQSRFSIDHPEFAVADANGVRQWGVLALEDAAVRAHLIERFVGFLDVSEFNGLFVCLRSQSRPADHADQFAHCGDSLTQLLRDLRAALQPRGRTLSVGVPRGDILGPPFGNAPLDWRIWARDGLIDGLVINQNASQCPSMWHQLWPMHRGTGYRQNYLTGEGLPPLEQHVRETYAPALAGTDVALYIARQWDARDAAIERRLAALPGVTGLVFSTFRHDNPDAIRRGDWRF
jgi:hypothetical protein